MDFDLVESRWDRVLDDALAADHSALRIVCPFIKERAAGRLLRAGNPHTIHVITRFNHRDFYDGVSDTAALRLLLQAGGSIRGVRGLHAKLYLFGNTKAVVTSANLTEAALLRNHELGFISSEAAIVARCRDYFDDLWKRAGDDLNAARLDGWDRHLDAIRAGGARPSTIAGLGDEGADAGLSTMPPGPPPSVGEAPQAFVKFFGESNNREDWDRPILEEVREAGCHWACTYPRGKRPRQVKDGAVMFIGRLVKEPADTLIFGRAVALQYREGRDDATQADIQFRSWKDKWPHYVRVHHADFIAGTLKNGVPLSQLMDELKHNAFASTKKHAEEGSGNTNPRAAYRQKAAVELSEEGYLWLSARLNTAFQLHGRIAAAELEQLDWPRAPDATGR